MRTILIPALALIMGYPAFADDEHHDWKYRAHRGQRSQMHWDDDEDERPVWDHARFERGRYRRPRREVIVVHPEPPIVHVHPLPPPPPVGIHFWFGF